jgi:glycosyltransferase involved in cell wall biosynthesis
MRRVLFYIWSLGVGGAEKHTLDLAAALRRRGVDARVLVHRGGCDPALNPDPELPIGQVGGGGFAKVADWARAWRAMAELKPDVVVGVNQSATIVASLGRALGRVPCEVLSVFHTTQLAKRSDWPKMLAYLAATAGGRTVFCSANQLRFWRARGFGGATRVITNGIDVGRFSPAGAPEREAARAALDLSPDDYVVGLVAAFRPEKNHGGLLEAVAALRARGVPAKALLVGDGPRRQAVAALAETLGVSDHVLMVGRHADVRPFVTAMDVGVLSSTAVETFSLAALELMASGLPMVMTDIGGASEMVEDGRNGFLVPPGDVAALADRLERLADPARRTAFGRAARDNVVAAFTFERMVDDYAALLA